MAKTPVRPSPGARTGAYGLRAIAETVDRLTAPLAGSQRLLAADLVLAWASLAGEALGASSYPDRLVFPPKRRADGTLHLRVASGAAALEIQHESRRLIERINAHLGYAAVARLKVIQAPLPPISPRAARAVPPPQPSATPKEGGAGGEPNAIEAMLTGVEDERLRLALARLGRRVLASAGSSGMPSASREACRDDAGPV